jgi:hypothetical protein
LKRHDTIEETNIAQEFLVLFGGKRFKTRIQKDTLLALVNDHGYAEVLNLCRWAAKQGMSMGRAVIAIESALKKRAKKNEPQVVKVGN